MFIALLINSPANTQTPNPYLAAGDIAWATNRVSDALDNYRNAAAAEPDNYLALWKTCLAAVTLAEFHPRNSQRASLLAVAEAFGRRAVAANAADAAGHFCLARALGRIALSIGLVDRARYAVEIRQEALAALAVDSRHAGALHIMGLWHHQVMRLSRLQRVLARTLLGATVLGDASWEAAERNLEAAVEIEPYVIAHRLDLGRLYVERKLYEKAVTQFQWILQAPLSDYNDHHYRAAAEVALEMIRRRQ